ncbi:MAG TPA: T9SS type A sorting domain-containing protein, partial [Bacteroidia bacterium]|nr:T9SS type A sorting domain-containing protein [Bacteroidia bacterium]
GATYNAGPTFLGEDPTTNKRAESPNINTIGRKNIQIAFKYIENGDGNNDNAALVYSTNGGGTWTTYNNLAKTPVCVSGQGQWTQYSVFLPSACENISNLKIGFTWTNNSDGVGTDPSFAVDDIVLSFINNEFTSEYFPANPQIVYNNILAGSLNNLSNCEYWTLNQNQGSTSRDVTLSWNASSCNITTLPDLRVARFDGAMWNDYGNGATSGNVAAGTVTSSFISSSFGPFAIANVTVLPVELISYNAKQESEIVKLNWTTASELNNSHFTIERSIDLKLFEQICMVNGNGTTSTINHYECFDNSPYKGVNFYRLKQFDIDGIAKEERTIAVNFSNIINSDIQVYGDAKNQLIYIKGSLLNGSSIYISDISGRVIYRRDLLSEQNDLILPVNIAKGVYLVSIRNAGSLQTVKLYY